jgi:hypothetical protein
MTVKILETNVSLLRGPGDELGVHYTQEIPGHHIQELRDRHTGVGDPTGDLLWVGEVPAATADRWMREGYNVFEEPIRKTLAKLKAEDMGVFVGTSKRI